MRGDSSGGRIKFQLAMSKREDFGDLNLRSCAILMS